MMKFIFMLIFSNMMMMVYKKFFINLYFNMLFFMSFMFIFIYMDSMVIYSNMMMMYFGMDNYAFFLMILSIWILGLMMMSLLKNEENLKLKMFMFLMLVIIFMGFFSSLNLMFFYFFFEVSLIPTFFLIIYWGSNPERLMAGFYLMMYTLFISLPLLIYIFWMFKKLGSFNLILMSLSFFGLIINFFDYLIIFSAFFIKMPIYMFHIWLPKAHVEAPVYGSMVLAAILLKLGTYGLIRMMMIFISTCVYYNFIIFSLSIIGSFLVSILCLSQIDMKMLVAYSSVVHMNFLLLSMLSLTKMGFLSSYIMMIGHGLCSSGLFYMVTIYYQKTGSRLVFLNKGMLSMLPMYSIWWFLLCCSNFSFPLSLNFISELLMIGVVISWNKSMMLYMMLICFFSSAYSLYLFSYIQHGNMNLNEKINFSLIKELMVMILHIYPMMFILLNLILFY
uniref:NADH dehydrogenase subunit 4 n=1 Tax=Tapinoma ibericum TaxID=2005328 RepID=UPI002176E68E|nr:NADH dehydrogenase subunit 4 [Tapinoma ibericum]UUF93600.1 NADH dehydrogenase subunit 4 [Tapinoma ibericum]